ncbi:MAG: GyrI-like domain-containing protein [Myxococcota bacterium]
MKTSSTRNEYIARINRVLDVIDANPDRPFDGADLARVAGFSRYHFHRVFVGIVGETPGRFIQRVRLERAAHQLRQRLGVPITTIGFDAGFSSSATFARAFRERFGVSPSQWRAGEGDDRNLGMTIRNPGAAIDVSRGHPDPATHHWTWRVTMASEEHIQTIVTVRDLVPVEMAYVRHIGPYAQQPAVFTDLIGRLMRWAGPRGLFRPPETKLRCIYHDSPQITDQDKLRISLGIPVPAQTPVDGEIGRMTLEGGATAVARFEISGDQYGAAWQAVYAGWLPESGYQPDDRLPYEVYLNDPNAHPQKRHQIEICVPVRPL